MIIGGLSKMFLFLLLLSYRFQSSSVIKYRNERTKHLDNRKTDTKYPHTRGYGNGVKPKPKSYVLSDSCSGNKKFIAPPLKTAIRPS